MRERSVKKILAPLFFVLSVVPLQAQANYTESNIEARNEGDASPVGYNTVAEALAALTAKPGAFSRVNGQGWREIEEKRENVLWSFVPEDHPAYPAVVRRTTSGRGMAIQVDMSALCEADRSACESLMKELTKMNQIARNLFIRMPARGMGAKADMSPIASLMSSVPR